MEITLDIFLLALKFISNAHKISNIFNFMFCSIKMRINIFL